MDAIAEASRKAYKTLMFVILGVVNFGFVFLHNLLISKLQRPAGLFQGLIFCFNHFGDYAGALLVGIFSWGIWGLLLISCFVTAFDLFDQHRSYEYTSMELSRRDIIELIIKFVFMIAVAVVDTMFAGTTFLLLGVLIAIIAAIIFIAWIFNS